MSKLLAQSKFEGKTFDTENENYIVSIIKNIFNQMDITLPKGGHMKDFRPWAISVFSFNIHVYLL